MVFHRSLSSRARAVRQLRLICDRARFAASRSGGLQTADRKAGGLESAPPWGLRCFRRVNSTTALLCFTLAQMSRGVFVTFEGSEGCGKSTQVQRLAARLEHAGVPVLVTREPGGTAIGEKIRHLLQFAPESFAMTPEGGVLLSEASRSQLVRETIQPALEKGTVVISDRFFDSTTVYQGVARKLS